MASSTLGRVDVPCLHCAPDGGARRRECQVFDEVHAGGHDRAHRRLSDRGAGAGRSQDPDCPPARLSPALLSTATFFGTEIAYLINNALVISVVFNLPGLASALGAVMYNPPTFPPGVQGQFSGLAYPFGTTGNVPVVIFLFALITMVVNLIVDATIASWIHGRS